MHLPLLTGIIRQGTLPRKMHSLRGLAMMNRCRHPSIKGRNLLFASLPIISPDYLCLLLRIPTSITSNNLRQARLSKGNRLLPQGLPIILLTGVKGSFKCRLQTTPNSTGIRVTCKHLYWKISTISLSIRLLTCLLISQRQLQCIQRWGISSQYSRWLNSSRWSPRYRRLKTYSQLLMLCLNDT